MVSSQKIINQEGHRSTLGASVDEIYKIRAGEFVSSPEPDAYEETDECDLEHSGQTVWLVKLPHFIRDRWGDIPSDSEEDIELGTIMINKNDTNSIKMVLSDTQDINKGLPRVYDLRNSSRQRVNNTFVFTEKDTKKRKRKDEQDRFPEIPVRLQFKEGDDRVANIPKWDGAKGEGKSPLTCKIEHRPTSVVGTVIAEMQMQPAQNVEYNRLECERQIAAKKKNKKAAKISYMSIKNNTLNLGMTGGVVNKQFLKIIHSDNSRIKVDKAYRAPKEEIQTRLFDLFEKYEYYPAKALVEKLCQPEAYLREILEEIGTYNTHGEFSGNWCLKSEYKQPMFKNKTLGITNK